MENNKVVRIWPERSLRDEAQRENIRFRQERIRELYRETLARPDETSTVGEVCLAMLPNGEIRMVAVCIEPEQVPTYLAALDKMRNTLVAHQKAHMKERYTDQPEPPPVMPAPMGRRRSILAASTICTILCFAMWQLHIPIHP